VAHNQHGHVANRAGDDRCPTGAGCVSGWAVWLIVIVAVAVTVLCVYGLWAIWPDGQTGSVTIVMFAHRFTITAEEQLFALVALAGALGGLVHLLRSLARYVGNRQLRWSWIAHYALLPFVGAAGSTIVYVVARAGLITPPSSNQTGVEAVNPFGFAALAVLVGLFTEEAMQMLKRVAGTVFAPPEAAHDQLDVPDDETPQ
jgi:hypothetical protein